MTSGTKIIDQTVSIACESNFFGAITSLGSWPIGSYWSKTWTGADQGSPSQPATETWWKWVTTKNLRAEDAADPDIRNPQTSGVRPLPGGRGVGRQGMVLRRVRQPYIPPKRARFDDHPYNCTITSWFDSPYAIDNYVNNGLTYTGYVHSTFREQHNLGYGVATSSLWSDNDTLACQGKLREAILGSDFNAGTFLAEGNQSLAMIANSAIRIRKALDALKRGDTVGAARALMHGRPGASVKRAGSQIRLKKDVSANWLELMYGWLPLVQDAEAAAQALAKQLNEPLVQTYRVRKKRKLVLVPNSTVLHGSSEGSHTQMQIIARLSEVNIPQLTGLTDVASIAWELTPYSFVVDWFIPIGNYLAARGLAQSLTGSFITTTSRLETFQCHQRDSSKAAKVMMGPSYGYMKKTVDRVVSTNLSIPKPSVKPLAKAASWQHCANALALLVRKHGS